jgi:hypothetical protein
MKITKRTCKIHGWPYDSKKAREGKLYAELERIDGTETTEGALPRLEKRLMRTFGAWVKLKQRRARLIKRIEKPAPVVEPALGESPEAKALEREWQGLFGEAR